MKKPGKYMKMANDDIVNQNFKNDTIMEYEWPPKVIIAG